MTPEEIVQFARENIAKAKAEQRRKAEEAAARRPKLVTQEGEIVGSAVVGALPDPNFPRRRSEVVIVREDLAMIQRAEREAYERHLREIDPYGVGLWPRPAA